jgi:hypothetical protein
LVQLGRSGYTDTFLPKFGCAVGSMIVMTENEFTMVDAWDEMTLSVIIGLRSIHNFVAVNPQWRILEIFDRFNIHVLSHNANVLRLDAKIPSLKEEGDASHANQSYDKPVAKGDTQANTDILSLMRTAFKVSNTIYEQWSMVIIGCYAVYNTRCLDQLIRGLLLGFTHSSDVCGMVPANQ